VKVLTVSHLLRQRPRRWQTIQTVAYLFRSLTIKVCYSLFLMQGGLCHLSFVCLWSVSI